MKYEKPEIAAVGAACTSVYGSSKDGINVELSEHPTVAAYEADE